MRPSFLASRGRGTPNNERVLHPVVLDLVLGVDLTSRHLASIEGGPELDALRQMLANAEYWLSFDPGGIEPWLNKCPSPLRELGVGVALRFGERIGGGLGLGEIAGARQGIVRPLPPPLRQALSVGLDVLERAVRMRELGDGLAADGFKPYVPAQSLSVHALRAGGKARITIDAGVVEKPEPGASDLRERGAPYVFVPVGRPLALTAEDERGRRLPPPEIESTLNAPLLFRDGPEELKRWVVFTIPGEYLLRVPGRAAGDLKILAR